MKKTWVRMLCFLLAAGMLLSGLPDCLSRAAAAGNFWVKLPIQAADNCRVYYNERITGEPWSSELQEAAVGPGIAHTGLEWPYGILLFVAPDDGYALSAFRADNTAGNYYSIADGEPDGTGCSFLSDPKHY